MSIALILAAFESLVKIGIDGADLLAKVREALGREGAAPSDEDWAALHEMETIWARVVSERMKTVG